MATKAEDDPNFGDGAPEGVAATEAANSAVSGANLIPVLCLGSGKCCGSISDLGDGSLAVSTQGHQCLLEGNWR